MENLNQYKVQKVVIRNFKGIEDLAMNVNGQHVILIGDNELGKSSALDAIWTNLSAKRIPKEPIKQGASKAEVMVVIGNDDMKYQIERKYTEKGSYLEITSPEGFKTSKIANLTSLVGDIDLDVFSFVELSKTVPGRREQVEIIKKFLDEETLLKLNNNNFKITQIKETRSGLNVRIRDLKGLVNTGTAEFGFEDVEKYAEYKDISEINDKYRVAIEHNNIWKRYEEKWCPGSFQELIDLDTILNAIDVRKKEKGTVIEVIMQDKYDAIEKLKKEISELVGNQKDLTVYAKAEKQKVTDFKKADTEALKEEYEAGKTHNDKVDKVKEHLKNKTELEEKTKDYDSWGGKITKVEQEIKQTISESKVPVTGLTFDEDGLYLDGLPFTEEQISTSKLMEVGVELAVAKNPKVKIIRINRGESLGEKKFAELIKFCNKKGYQLFIEKVDGTKKELKLQYFTTLKDLK